VRRRHNNGDWGGSRPRPAAGYLKCAADGAEYAAHLRAQAADDRNASNSNQAGDHRVLKRGDGANIGAQFGQCLADLLHNPIPFPVCSSAAGCCANSLRRCGRTVKIETENGCRALSEIIFSSIVIRMRIISAGPTGTQRRPRCIWAGAGPTRRSARIPGPPRQASTQSGDRRVCDEATRSREGMAIPPQLRGRILPWSSPKFRSKCTEVKNKPKIPSEMHAVCLNFVAHVSRQ
jgi:hypothetical protein